MELLSKLLISRSQLSCTKSLQPYENDGNFMFMKIFQMLQSNGLNCLDLDGTLSGKYLFLFLKGGSLRAIMLFKIFSHYSGMVRLTKFHFVQDQSDELLL